MSSPPASSPEGENFLWVFLESKMLPALSFFPIWELIASFHVNFIDGVHETILHPTPSVAGVRDICLKQSHRNFNCLTDSQFPLDKALW